MTMIETSIPKPLNARVADEQIVAGVLAGLDGMMLDCSRIIAQLPVAAYCAAPGGKSSIGAHMRHVLEFVQVLVDNLEGGVIDYETREHNAAYENDPAFVATTLPQLHAQLARALTRYGAYHPLLLRETASVGGPKLTVTTSLGREVLFMLQHGVHHLAIVKMLAEAMGYDLGNSLGIAVATQEYREQANG